MKPITASTSIPPFWISASVLLLGLVIFSVTLRGGFIGDDFVYVKRFLDLPWSRWPQLFTREWSEGIWGTPLKELRPFAALSFMADARFWGGNPAGWRVTNLTLFLGSAWLVTRLTSYYLPARPLAALIAGLVFVLHPIQAEPVTWITGRVDLLGTFAALLFWTLSERFSNTGKFLDVCGAALALFVGVFSKEFCLLAPLLLLISWLFIPDSKNPCPWPRRLVVLGAVFVVLAIYFWCRQEAFGSSSEQSKGLQHPGTWQRQVSYLGWLLPWLPFKPVWEFWPQHEELIKVTWISSATLIILTACWFRWRKLTQPATILFFGGAWWLITVGGLTVVGYFSPRHLHFASVGLAMAIGIALTAIPNRRLAGLASLAVISWFFAAHLAAIKPWQNNGKLSQQALALAQEALNRAPPDAALALTSPGILNNVWLWSWSGPQLAGAPFLRPGLSLEKVLCSESIYFRSDWADRARFDYPKILESASTLILLEISDDGVLTCRTLSGAKISSASTRFTALSADGLSRDEWKQWVNELSESR